jgi:hypothetical protein
MKYTLCRRSGTRGPRGSRGMWAARIHAKVPSGQMPQGASTWGRMIKIAAPSI